MHCSKCGGRFRSIYDTCPSCGIPLEGTLPEPRRVSAGAVFNLMLIVLGMLVVINIVSLLQGRVMALVPLIGQAIVLLLVTRGLPGAIWATRLWAVLLIASGFFYWLGIALKVFAWAISPERHGFQEAVTALTWKRALFFTCIAGLGWVFFVRAKAVVRVRSRAGHNIATSE